MGCGSLLLEWHYPSSPYGSSGQQSYVSTASCLLLRPGKSAISGTGTWHSCRTQLGLADRPPSLSSPHPGSFSQHDGPFFSWFLGPSLSCTEAHPAVTWTRLGQPPSGSGGSSHPRDRWPGFFSPLLNLCQDALSFLQNGILLLTLRPSPESWMLGCSEARAVAQASSPQRGSPT